MSKHYIDSFTSVSKLVNLPVCDILLLDMYRFIWYSIDVLYIAIMKWSMSIFYLLRYYLNLSIALHLLSIFLYPVRIWLSNASIACSHLLINKVSLHFQLTNGGIIAFAILRLAPATTAQSSIFFATGSYQLKYCVASKQSNSSIFMEKQTIFMFLQG